MVGLITGRFGVRGFNIAFPYYSGMMAKNADMRKVSVTRAVFCLRKTLALLKKNGVPPEAAHLMAVWGRPARVEDDEPLYCVEGKTDAVYSVKERIRVKNESCSRCVYDKVCMGFDEAFPGVADALEDAGLASLAGRELRFAAGAAPRELFAGCMFLLDFRRLAETVRRMVADRTSALKAFGGALRAARGPI